MAKPLVVRGLEIGSGMPKIIVPITAANLSDAVEQAKAAIEADADCIEWRIDLADYASSAEGAIEVLAALRSAVGEAPLLATYRTVPQGGKGDLPVNRVADLLGPVVESGMVDMLDIELTFGPDLVRALVDRAHAAGVLAVVSHHNFEETPAFDAIYDILSQEFELGADIPKIAVMANKEGDELALMAAANQFADDHPDAVLLAISMGEMGLITRLAGEFFGSALTFCAVGESSAPGQIDAVAARRLIEQLHKEGYSAHLTK